MTEPGGSKNSKTSPQLGSKNLKNGQNDQQHAQKQSIEPQKSQQIDIDALAKDEVDKIEKMIISSDSFKSDQFNSWLSILKQIITAADLHRTNDNRDKQTNDGKSSTEIGDSIYADYADDNEQFNAVDLTEQFATNSVKWTIRVRAFKLVHRLVQQYAENHSTKASILRQLPDLVRLSFVAATSPYDDLKVQGFKMFKFVIDRYAALEERELPGHSIMEQYKTQVLSALKPAFNPDAPPYITAIASQVCSLWICRYLETDPMNLRRSYQFMLSSIEKLEKQSVNQNSKLYTECELEQERLDILGSWAQLYIHTFESAPQVSNNSNLKIAPDANLSEELINLVRPQINSIIDRWWEALKDFALLTMPAPKFIGVSHDSEHVYTREVAVKLFDPIWPKLVQATTIWLCSEDFQVLYNKSDKSDESKQYNCDDIPNPIVRSSKEKYFKFLSGLLICELCKFCQRIKARKNNDTLGESITYVLKSLQLLTSNQHIRNLYINSHQVTREFHSLLSVIYFDRFRAKDIASKMVKVILDRMFEFMTIKLVKGPERVVFALTNLHLAIKKELSATARVGDDQVSDSLIMLTIHLGNLMTILKVNFDMIADQPELIDRLMDIFDMVLRSDGRNPIYNSFLGSLMNLYTVLGEERATIIVSRLFDCHLLMIAEFIDQSDKDRSSFNLETQLKFVRMSISKVSSENQPALIKRFLACLISKIAHDDDRINGGEVGSEATKNPRADLSRLLLRHVDELKKARSSDFDGIIGEDMEQKLSKLYDRVERKSTGASTKRNSQVSKKPTVHPHKATAKIALKADFVNFYAKKT